MSKTRAGSSAYDPRVMQSIGILGAGRIGTTLAGLFRVAGRSVHLSPGPSTNLAVVKDADVVVLAVPWSRLEAVAEQCAPALANKIVIDATNPYSEHYEVVRPDAPFLSAAAQNAERFGGAHLVKAFNTLASDDLAVHGSAYSRARVAVALCGDNAAAKAVVAQIVTESGYEPVDLGRLESAALQEPGGPYYARILRADEMRNAQVARRFVEEVLARGDMQAFDELVSDEIVVTSGISPLAPMVGKAAFAKGLGALAAFSDGALRLEDVLPTGDRVTVRYAAFATHTGDQLGVAPTGKRIKMWEIRLMRIADGRIVEDFVADINYDWPWLIAPRYRDAWLKEAN